MSHSVVTAISLSCENELKIVQTILNKVEKYQTKDIWNELMGEEINEWIVKANNLKRKLEELNGKEIWSNEQENYMLQIDSIVKRIGNLNEIINNQDLFEILKDNFIQNSHIESQEINKILLANGTTGIIAIEKLNEENTIINVQNLSSKISDIRNEQVNKETKKLLFKKIENKIKKLEMPNTFKIALIKSARKLHDLVEFADFNNLIDSRVVENERQNIVINQIKTILKEMGFKILDIDEYVTSENNFIKKISFRNDWSKKIEINLWNDMRLEYKMGGYEGHMCEADSSQFRLELKKNNLNLMAPIITRNVSNARPIEKKFILNTNDQKKEQ